MKPPPLQRILRIATALLCAAVLGATAWQGTEFGAGVLFSGLLMMGSLGAGWWLTRPDASGQLAPRVPLLLSFKFPLVLLGMCALLLSYPAAAVALGGAVLVTAITLDAAWSLRGVPGAPQPIRGEG